MCFVRASQRLLNNACSIGVEAGNIIINKYRFLDLPLIASDSLSS